MRRPALTVSALFAAALLSAGCGGSSDSGSEQSAFSYPQGSNAALTDRGVVNHGYPIRIHDVSFEVPDGGTVDAMLAVPPGKGPFPAVVYLHGSGGDRTQLLVPATWMAARGAVTLTLTMPEEAVGATGTAEERLVAQKRATVAAVVAARRAVDVLAARPDVDPDRIGLVGWSSGARVGAILAGVEPRLRAFDLISGGSPPVSDYASKAPASLRPAIERELGAVDPLRFVARAPEGSILLQEGRRDTVVPRSALDALAAAAGKAAEVRWYDQGHTPSEAAWHDQLEWMAARLGLNGPVVTAAASGP